jgi:pimeloyl-ACP methyl ester carboxylesterase
MQGFELSEESDRIIGSALNANTPFLFVWGERDPVLGGEIAKVNSLQPNQQLALLPQAKHFLMIDFPDEIAGTIVDWIEKQGH